MSHSARLEDVLLRAGSAKDLDAMHRLDLLCFDPPFRFTRSAMSRFARARGAVTLVAETSAAQLVGFLILQFTAGGGAAAYVVTLDVAPDYRRQGVARRLMQQAEREAVKRAPGAMSLHVWTENAAAISFYERLGYRRIALQPGFYGAGVGAYVYGKSLEQG